MSNPGKTKREVFQINIFPTKISIDKERKYKEKSLKEIMVAFVSLYNSGGGQLRLHYEKTPPKNHVNDCIRKIEQRIIEVAGILTMATDVQTNQSIPGQIIFNINPTTSRLLVLTYNLYFPSDKQVISVPPTEQVDRIRRVLAREESAREPILPESHINNFKMDQKVNIFESKTAQFKEVKAEKAKNVTIADRLSGKNNKFRRYAYAFSNYRGGHIYYGINDDGIVKGEKITKEDQDQIVKKVTKVINEMMWPEDSERDDVACTRGQQWDIHFEPVKDNKGNPIQSTFVIVIYIAQCPGGVFTEGPECYHMVEGEPQKMDFTDWKKKVSYPNPHNTTKARHEQPSKVDCTDMVPSAVGRAGWSSERTQTICHKMLQVLVKYQNDAKYDTFEKYAKLAKNHKDNVVRLFAIAEESTCAYKRGCLQKAVKLLSMFRKKLSSSKTNNDCLLKFRAVYAESAIVRAKRDYQESYKIAQEGLQLAEMVPTGILTAWFLNHVAILEKFLSTETKEEAKRVSLEQSALNHYIKALQHTKASSVEQAFSITIADLQQRIHIFRAITLLGDFATGANFRKATPSDIKAAETDLSAHNELVVQGHKETNYRKTYRLLAQSDLTMCQWWQQRQQQTEKEGSLEDFETPNILLKDAFDYATDAKELCTKFTFQELSDYANNRLKMIIETMLKLKVASIRLPREECEQ